MERVACIKGDLVVEKALFPQISGGGQNILLPPPILDGGGSALLPPHLTPLIHMYMEIHVKREKGHLLQKIRESQKNLWTNFFIQLMTIFLKSWFFYEPLFFTKTFFCLQTAMIKDLIVLYRKEDHKKINKFMSIKWHLGLL